ncbi:probable lactoylglutathione lyase protein [Rhizobium etli CFN 42]|uniref:Glyoxalase/bleomycin resistance protein/dioxygenase family protein n=2 Tax=Rhizobium etli TaxID=29449 RepID=A0AAN1EJF0_RHIET|nr:VOC family protein [Rhizobium etli]ABC90071.1 probable lactoylglutathione lyase protein [Rhizobium etli CFN 42]ARQ09388.1 glyoxalase/bleomycin resistance protein/dioxygenase family protein [Rhizobium etli]
MFDHISIGVKDLERARRFYDAALAPLGYERLSNSDGMIGYGPEQVGLWVMQVAHPVVADMQSGLHFCFVAPNEAAVDAFYAAAIASGGTDNGEPGIRPDYGRFYYAAFVIDPDGYRLEAYFNKGEI